MKKIIFFLPMLTAIFLFFFSTSYAQSPAITWQNTIGGSGDDYLRAVCGTADGGYLIGGSSNSNISGDKTENSQGGMLYGYDYWVVKVNSVGIIEWQNDIGGIGEDYLRVVQQTADGGYILGGYSNSAISGDKTEPAGGYDYWVVKLNSTGNIVWQNTIGATGTNYDELFTLQQTTDGGYILGGHSWYGTSGDKTDAGVAGYDYWVVKLNSTGSIVWQNAIGGNHGDYLRSIQQTSDGGYILGGWSESTISGDKTESTFDGDGYGVDYWVIKLNALGGIVWQNDIGGDGDDYLNSVQQTSDGGYILAGYSNSTISGDKTVYDAGKDYWVIKLNATGAIQWQNTFGGTGGVAEDILNSIIQTSDGGFILAGYSTSGLSGDKSETFIGVGYAYSDYWVIKINELGNIVWQNTIGGSSVDGLSGIIQKSDGSYLLAGYSLSGITGDKSEATMGGADYWIVKINSDCFLLPDICNGLDDNCNGLIDDGTIETCNGYDDNCNGIIDEGVPLSVSLSATGPTAFCKGGEVTLTASYSGTDVTWFKNGIVIPSAYGCNYIATQKGIYTCRTSNACANATSAGIFVNVEKLPAASITAGGATTFCAGGSVTLTESPLTGVSYQWYKGPTLLAGETTTNYIATTAGNYKCRVTKTASGCYKNSNIITVTVPCKEGEALSEENINFTIYPNPNTGTFNFVYNAPFGAPSPFEGGSRGMISLEIFNSLGQQIHSQQLNSSDGNINETISIKNLSSGIYFIRINNLQQKLIIE